MPSNDTKCVNCGLWGDWEKETCPDCIKYGDRIFFISDDLNRKHIRGDHNCKGCGICYYFESFPDDVKFPLIHEGCGGLIHYDVIGFDDGDGRWDINLIFQCEKCKAKLDTWLWDAPNKEFKKRFGFLPKKEEKPIAK